MGNYKGLVVIKKIVNLYKRIIFIWEMKGFILSEDRFRVLSLYNFKSFI